MATVLVVDDEHGVAELFNGILTDKGHRVLAAINGKHGLEVLAEKHVDLVLLDFMMPVMGAAVMLELLMANPVWQKIPAVIMSALPERIIATRCYGYVDILTKPLRFPQIEGVIERLENDN